MFYRDPYVLDFLGLKDTYSEKHFVLDGKDYYMDLLFYHRTMHRLVVIDLKEANPRYIESSKGLNLKPGYVPGTEYFLWDDDKIVGLFRIRHHLCEALANGAGHIGYGIRKEFRGKGYANEGLRLTIEKAWTIIPEDEIYMSVHKDNTASLKAQLKNGAYIHHEDEKEYYTRIKREQ